MNFKRLYPVHPVYPCLDLLEKLLIYSSGIGSAGGKCITRKKYKKEQAGMDWPGCIFNNCNPDPERAFHEFK
jgi:hypothetical protein